MLRAEDLHTDPVLARKIRRIQQSRIRAASEEEEEAEQELANSHSLLIPSDLTVDIDDADGDGRPVDIKHEKLKRERSVGLANGNEIAPRGSMGTTATQSIVVDLGSSTEEEGEEGEEGEEEEDGEDGEDGEDEEEDEEEEEDDN